MSSKLASFCVVSGSRLQVVTVATSDTDGFSRFLRSTKLFGLNVEVSITIVFVT